MAILVALSVGVFTIGWFLVCDAKAEPENMPTEVEVLTHDWKPDEVWERIGKTKYLWHATVRNNTDQRQRIFVYYELLDAAAVPLARNATNTFVGPRETVNVTSDSYITTSVLSKVVASRATVKVDPLGS